jgi:hypothetical protein
MTSGFKNNHRLHLLSSNHWASVNVPTSSANAGLPVSSRKGATSKGTDSMG